MSNAVRVRDPKVKEDTMRTQVAGRIPVVFLVVAVALATFTLGESRGRAQSAAPQAEATQSTLIPRFLSLPPEFATLHPGASYELNGGGDVSGLVLPNSGFPRYSVGFSLPPDYAPGTDMIVRIIWSNSRFNATSCGFVLWNNGLVAYRPNASRIFGSAVFPNGLETITLAAPSTSEQVRSTTLTIRGSSGGSAIYQPGDALSLLITRRTDDAPDTCTGKLFIVGMDVTYQGLTSYMPLVTN
jgi:hypothetical protein